MLLRPRIGHLKLCSALFLMVLLFVSSFQAQTKKSTDKKQAAGKKSEKTAKDARKDSASAKKEKLSAKDKEKTKQAELKKKESADKNKNRQADAKKKDSNKEKGSKKESKKELEIRRAEEVRRRVEELEQRRAEEIRRQAILAEKRRREQAAREARARALAFERGLRTETVANIAKDDTEGEDLQVRRAAISALGSHAGTVVVMETQTGKILTVVNQDWAVRSSYRPCSTIKLVTGVAGLNENVIDRNDGSINNFRMNLDDALAFSNNVYFQKVGVNIGNAKIISYARALGLGEPTGANYDNEAAGKLPYNNSSRLIYSHGDDFEVSPLQLAVMVSAISNGGKVVVPQVARSRNEQANFRGFLRRQVNLPMQNVTGVIPGMVGAAQYGTARRGVDAGLGVAGKTGSCIGKGSWLGLFASVAPVQNPKYSVVVITRGQAERGKYAAAVAGKVYQALQPRLQENRGEQTNLALAPYRIAPKPQINAKNPVDSEDEDEENSAEDAEIEAGGDTAEPVKKALVPKKETSTNQPLRNPIVKKLDKTAVEFPSVVIKVRKRAEETIRPRVVVNK
ncbi:MAG: penicillin-binding transpeptidase domain-containing protein [Acidobacteriota bacterium]|nr:penicillin-binding transpeptidase domain-containing protein [Acidobacteriota bacterium]